MVVLRVAAPACDDAPRQRAEAEQHLREQQVCTVPIQTQLSSTLSSERGRPEKGDCDYQYALHGTLQRERKTRD